MTYVAIGSNLSGTKGESSLDICHWALEQISLIPGVTVRAVSKWYRTAPQPPSGQPDYVNGVVSLDVRGGADWLLRQLQAIEYQGGRVRSEINAARTLDLDLIAMGDVLRDAYDPQTSGPDFVSDMVLPHPRAHERAFVLIPLRDVAPDWIHPRLKLDIGSLILDLDPQPISVMKESEFRGF